MLITNPSLYERRVSLARVFHFSTKSESQAMVPEDCVLTLWIVLSYFFSKNTNVQYKKAGCNGLLELSTMFCLQEIRGYWGSCFVTLRAKCEIEIDLSLPLSFTESKEVTFTL